MATGTLGMDCATILGNTGVTVCPFDINNIGGVLLVPSGTVWTLTDVSGIQAKIAAGISNISPTARYYPIHRFTEMEDKGTDAVETESAYGVGTFVRNGKYRFRFMYTNGGMDMHAELSKFNDKADSFDVWLIDHAQNILLGTSSGQNNVRGFSLDTLYVPNVKVNTGSETTKYSIEIGLRDETQFNLNWRIISIPKTIPILDTFQGLKPTRLEVVTELVGSTKTVIVRVWSGATNLYDTYTSELATTSIWSITRNATGLNTAASAVTATPATKSFTIVSSTMASTSAGDECTVKLGTVAALTSAGIIRQANAECQTTAT